MEKTTGTPEEYVTVLEVALKELEKDATKNAEAIVITKRTIQYYKLTADEKTKYDAALKKWNEDYTAWSGEADEAKKAELLKTL